MKKNTIKFYLCNRLIINFVLLTIVLLYTISYDNPYLNLIVMCIAFPIYILASLYVAEENPNAVEILFLRKFNNWVYKNFLND